MFYVVKEVKRVDRAVNDATLNQAGNVYQYLVALKDCYELMEQKNIATRLRDTT